MNDKKKNKKYVIPEAEVVEYADEDIITVSRTGGALAWGGEEDYEDWE